MREQAEVMTPAGELLSRPRAGGRAREFDRRRDRVRPVVDGLVRTFEKVYRDRGLAFEASAPPGLRFRGESQDLADLIGNLLDNAGKWARARVEVAAERDAAPTPRAALFSSRTSTTTVPGSTPRRARRRSSAAGGSTNRAPAPGLGLSIVVDLAANYGGSLRLEDSPLGGLRATLAAAGVLSGPGPLIPY